jgi:hypothetical protein
METEHSETVVEKVTSYVKDMLGIPQAEESKPAYEDIAPALHFGEDEEAPHAPLTAPEPTIEDAMRLEPLPYPTSAAEAFNDEGARRDDGAGI